MIRHIDKMTVAAHRGDCYNFYENTMTAFENAINAGADMIETDVHLSKDDVIFLMHDHTVDRTTNGKGKLSDMTAEEIQNLNAGDDFHPEKVPMFEELIKLAVKNDITLNIEIKEYYSEENEERCIRCIENVIELVEKYDLREKIVLNSFDAWVLEYIYKKYGKKYMLHGFYPYEIMKNVSLNPDDYLYCACLFDSLNKAYYDHLIEKNIEPWIGASVTQEAKLKACSKYGAKLVTTNNPADTISKLKNLGLRK